MKEYIAMFDHPVIQDNWQPKVGDRYFMKETNKIWAICKHDEDCTGFLAWTNTLKHSSIYLPSTDDLLGMLEKLDKYEVFGCDAGEHILDDFYAFEHRYANEPWQYGLLRMYMHIESGLSWDGGKWG